MRTWLLIFSISSSSTFSIFQSPLIWATSNKKCLRSGASRGIVAVRHWVPRTATSALKTHGGPQTSQPLQVHALLLLLPLLSFFITERTSRAA